MIILELVRAAGLEPAKPKPRDFKSLVFTNFTTPLLKNIRFLRLYNPLIDVNVPQRYHSGITGEGDGE